jgi:hypothetical protein
MKGWNCDAAIRPAGNVPVMQSQVLFIFLMPGSMFTALLWNLWYAELRVLRLGGYAAETGGYGASLQDLDIHTLSALPLLQDLHLSEARVRVPRGISVNHACGKATYQRVPSRRNMSTGQRPSLVKCKVFAAPIQCYHSDEQGQE